MLVPNTNTRARCTGDDESAPKTRDSTRRRCNARSRRHVNRRACSRRHPWGDGPRPQDWRGGVRTKGAPFTSAQRSRILAQVVAHASAGLGKALAMRQQPPLPGLVVSTPRRRAPVARPILPRPRPTFLLSRSNVALATLAVAAVARRLVSHPARARALARLARLAARGPAPRSRTAPIRDLLTYLLTYRWTTARTYSTP